MMDVDLWCEYMYNINIILWYHVWCSSLYNPSHPSSLLKACFPLISKYSGCTQPIMVWQSLAFLQFPRTQSFYSHGHMWRNSLGLEWWELWISQDPELGFCLIDNMEINIFEKLTPWELGVEITFSFCLFFRIML